MKKTKEELVQLKQEYESLNDKLKNLSEEELKEVVGGSGKIKTHPRLRLIRVMVKRVHQA